MRRSLWHHRPRATAAMAVTGLALAACGSAAPTPSATPAGGLSLSPQNSTLLVGVNRLSVAIFDRNRRPVNGATATLQVQGSGGTFERRPLQYIGPQYGQIPVYLTAVRFTGTGQYRLVVDAAMTNGTHDSGSAFVTVTDRSPSLPVGHAMPPLRQKILGDPGVTLTQIDSGVPPDDWHHATIADGLAQHRPMVLYFGEPGFCVSQTCGPTVQVLQQLCATYCSRLVFEHIEVGSPAGPFGKVPLNPAFSALGLDTEPWIYFVDAQGVVSDRFEGPVTVEQLRQAADGTLAGRVPAVDVALL